MKNTAKANTERWARVGRDAERIHYHRYPSWALRTVHYVVILALIPLLASLTTAKVATSTNALNSSIILKANQSDMDEMEATLNTKANQSDLAVSVQPEQRHFNDWLSKVPPLSCGARGLRVKTPNPLAPTKFAVVVQGPLSTVTSISWGGSWLHYAPDVEIIISSWWEEGPESRRILDEYQQHCFHVVLDDLHNFTSTYGTGFANVNLQQHATYNGLLKAEELGAEYVVKVRSDVFVRNPFVFLTLLFGNMPSRLSPLGFSANKNNDGTIGELYAWDWIYVGPISDLSMMFSPPYQDATDTRFPEKYLQETYMHRKGLWSPGGDGKEAGELFCQHSDALQPILVADLIIAVRDALDDSNDVAYDMKYVPGLLRWDDDLGKCSRDASGIVKKR